MAEKFIQRWIPERGHQVMSTLALITGTVGGSALFGGWKNHPKPRVAQPKVTLQEAASGASTEGGLGLTIDNADDWFSNEANMQKFEKFIDDGSLEKATENM